MLSNFDFIESSPEDSIRDLWSMVASMQRYGLISEYTLNSIEQLMVTIYEKTFIEFKQDRELWARLASLSASLLDNPDEHVVVSDEFEPDFWSGFARSKFVKNKS